MELKTFLEIEHKYGLIEERLDGFAFWTYFRSNLAMGIREKADHLGAGYIYPTRSPIQKMMARLGTVRYALAYGRLPQGKHDVLILNGERRKWAGDHYECLYTDRIAAHYPDSVVLERPYFQGHFRPVKTKNLTYTDSIEIKTMAYWYSRQLFHKKQITEIREKMRAKIERPLAEICDAYQVHYKIDQILDKMVCGYYVYQVKKREFAKILDRTKPKVILEVVGYNIDCLVVNELALARHIPTVELQHGVAGREHVAYNYYAGTHVEQFPQYFFAFSKFWIDSTAYPLPADKIRAVGFPYLEEKAKLLKKKMKKAFPHQILFISQTIIGEAMAEVAVKLNELIDKEQYRIIYKLHPGECERWREHYLELAASGIEVIDNNIVDLYELFAASEYQIGGHSSTAIFEGLQFGLRTYVMKETASPLFADLCEKGMAQFFDTAQDLYRLITSDSEGRQQADGFWKENALENMIREIDSIMNRAEAERNGL